MIAALELFKRKMASGKYDHYGEKELAQLMVDCHKQVKMKEEINGGKKNENKGI